MWMLGSIFVKMTEYVECANGSELWLQPDVGEGVEIQWTLNGNDVETEDDELNEYHRFTAYVNDSGRYEGHVEGVLTVVYNVIVQDYKEFKLGSPIKLDWNTHRNDQTWTFNDENIQQRDVCKQNAEFINSGLYRCSIGDSVKFACFVVVYCDLEFELGYPINIPVNSCNNPQEWTVNDKVVISVDDEEHNGFKKEDAWYGDQGKYECTFNGRLRYAFNVIINQTITCKIGSKIQMCDQYQTDHPLLLSLTLNGRNLNWKYKPGEGFVKRVAENTDSGRYECTIADRLSFAFDVIIYGDCVFKFGSTIYLDAHAAGVCPTYPSWIFGRLQESLTNDSVNEFEIRNAVFSDSGKYIRKIGDKVTNEFNVTVYENLFEDEFLGIRIAISKEPPNKKPGISTGAQTTSMIDNARCIFKSVYQQFTAAKLKIEEYILTTKPRGTAVIITIGEFENEAGLTGIKNSIGMWKATCEKLNLSMEHCEHAKEKNVIEFLKGIAEKVHSDCDCFVLFIRSRAGNGFMCCSDFNRNDLTNLIFFDKLLNIFLDVKSLQKTPKLFFFDYCQQQNYNHEKLMKQLPINVLNSTRDVETRYSELLIGYAENNRTGGNSEDNVYTQTLTDCLSRLATCSLVDVMDEVNRRMKEVGKVSHYESTLSNTVTMKKSRNSVLMSWYFLLFFGLFLCFLYNFVY